MDKGGAACRCTAASCAVIKLLLRLRGAAGEGYVLGGWGCKGCCPRELGGCSFEPPIGAMDKGSEQRMELPGAVEAAALRWDMFRSKKKQKAAAGEGEMLQRLLDKA